MSYKEEDYNVQGVALNQIRNRYELIVIKKMNDLLPKYPDFDNCSLCIEDVYALSLSRMPAIYTHKGSVVLHKELTSQDIEELVIYSILKIMQNPKHT